MKTFDLVAAKVGKPLQKRNGEKVTFVTYVPGADVYNRVVVLDSERKIQAYSEQGTYNIFGGPSDYDIFMATEKKTLWINLYPAQTFSNIFDMGYYYDSEEEADKLGYKTGRIGGKAYPVEVEL